MVFRAFLGLDQPDMEFSGKPRVETYVQDRKVNLHPCRCNPDKEEGPIIQSGFLLSQQPSQPRFACGCLAKPRSKPGIEQS
jgi:hypothetical protein